ncbi:protein lethal(2)essential for life-like [Danaus plexippus]|uniref:Small heat shock protein n=1 Tax=Danaus plexippus plexippus TaxID=278856 RepID=A0A212FI15_DANPL|nr:protein lethal(2)essential for life-like [Danaus plexippus]OWR53385.1 small heat shock protein [Danaus plexippus plexippus]
MYKYALIVTALFGLTVCEERPHKTQYVDPFAMIDRHLTHSLAYHYLWPWSQLIRAAAALDVEESLEDPQIISDSEKYQVNLSVRRFKPEELKIKVKNRYIIVEGKHKEQDNDKKIMANHFVQRFVLPPGTKQEEVTAVLNEKNILTISAPKHEIPPPPPEREVPIEVLSKTEETEGQTEKNKLEKQTPSPVIETSATPEEQVDPEATTHIGKIRKKELKTTTKATKYNEATKSIESNGLDYGVVEGDE